MLICGCGAVLCILWFFLELRKKVNNGRSVLISLATLVLGIVLSIVLARIVWVLCMLRYHYPLLNLKYDELSYYGGMAGVILAVCLSSKIGGLNLRETLNTFAPMGALFAAVIRFSEGCLGDFGCGEWMEEGIFFPVTVEFASGDYSDFYPAIFTRICRTF